MEEKKGRDSKEEDLIVKDKKERKIEPMLIKEFEESARTKVHPAAWRYLSYYAGTLTPLMARQFLDNLRLRPRILRDVSEVDTSVTLMDGSTIPFPVIIAPTAFHKLFHSDGELATARAASRMGIMYSYNIFLSSVSIDTIANDPIANKGPKWLHIYFLKSKEFVKTLIQRGEKTGMFSAILATCDHPHNRVQDYMVPDMMQYLKDFGLDGVHGLNPNAVSDDGDTLIQADVAMNNSLTWKDLEWLRSITKLPIIAKGVLDEEDAVTAARCGASAIVVSNHGGRQLDGAVPAIEALPHIVAALKKENLNIDVYVDSGIRSGVDIVKAVSLGAKAVLLGRPVVWGLAHGGEAGLARLLTCLKEDFTNDLMSLGCTKVADLGPHIFWNRNNSNKAML